LLVDALAVQLNFKATSFGYLTLETSGRRPDEDTEDDKDTEASEAG
jgi:hypothetical protein